MSEQKYLALFDLMGELARYRFSLAEQTYAPLGLNHTAARALYLLSVEPLAQDQLSARFMVDRSNVGRAVKTLEQQGLVVRQANPADKRTSLLALTPAGQQLAVTVLNTKQQIIEQFFQGLDPDEASVVYGLLKKIRR
ncbi:MAG TPA: hypothetical protein DCS87_00460 [Rheinheimera sp.]|nr:hypothetical protein [Rheinheimera sp.]